MDSYGIPKKVVRHVQKAVGSLKSLQKPIRFPNVLAEVKFTMRNLVPVSDLNSHVRRCLKNIKNGNRTQSSDDNHLEVMKTEPNAIESRASVSNMESQPQIFQCDASSQYSGNKNNVDAGGDVLRPEKRLRRKSTSKRVRSIRDISTRRTLASIAKPSSKHYKAFKPSQSHSKKLQDNSFLKKYHIGSQGELYSCTGLCSKALRDSPALAEKRLFDKLQSAQCQCCKGPLNGPGGRYLL